MQAGQGSGTAPESGALKNVAGRDSLSALLGERELNLRQVILRAHREMNRWITRLFVERGYRDLRPEHLTVLANMNLGETAFDALAERAQMSPAGIRELAGDLQSLGYLASDRPDGVRFTDEGWELMLASFNIQREIEAAYGSRLEAGDLDHLRRILARLTAPT